jgi:polyisoprenyl-teichoic acid--peptidoglycan teichoic acid transferase
MLNSCRAGLKLLIGLSVSLCACLSLTAGSFAVFQQAKSLALSPASGPVRSLSARKSANLMSTVTAQPSNATSTQTSNWTEEVVYPVSSTTAPAGEAALSPMATVAPFLTAPETPTPAALAMAVGASARRAAPSAPTAVPDSDAVSAAAPEPLAAPETRPQTFNVVLLGTDRNETGKGTWRTDVMALVALNPDTQVAGVLAIPRDLFVNIPDHEPDRINTVDFLGHYTKYPGDGQALLNRTLRENFGFGFDRFIRIDFNGFSQVIDELGGIDVDVDCPLEELFADPVLPQGRLLKVSAGLQHMDGPTALLYVRQRHDNGDTDRSRRQFKVLMALREKALKLDTLPLLPKLWTTYRANVQTDLSVPEILQLARWMVDFKTENLRGRIIDQTLADPWTKPKGAWVLLPRVDQIKAAYNDLLTAPSLSDASHRARCPK